MDRWNKLAVAESWRVGSDASPTEFADPRTPEDVELAHISEIVVSASGARGLVDGFTLQRVLITLIRDLTALVPAADYDVSDAWTIHYQFQNDLMVRLSLRFGDKTTLFDETMPYADALMVVTHFLASLYGSLERCGADINAENRLFCSEGNWQTFDLSWRPF